jgi:hypothetical protein
MDQVITANCFGFRIRKEGKGVPGFLTEVTRKFGSVYADRDGTNPRFFQLAKTILNTP